jgi:hypothetical protein
VTRVRHIGGAVIGDDGVIALGYVHALVKFYGLEALRARGEGQRRRAVLCARRALDLQEAATQAQRWRRAAGWTDPDAADVMQ